MKQKTDNNQSKSSSCTEQIAQVRDGLSSNYAAISNVRDVLSNISFSDICDEFGKNASTTISEQEIDQLISGNNIDITEQCFNKAFAEITNNGALPLVINPDPQTNCLKDFFSTIGELRANMNTLRKSQAMISRLNETIAKAIATDEKRIEVIQNHLQATVPMDAIRSAEKLVSEMEMLMEP